MSVVGDVGGRLTYRCTTCGLEETAAQPTMVIPVGTRACPPPGWIVREDGFGEHFCTGDCFGKRFGFLPP